MPLESHFKREDLKRELLRRYPSAVIIDIDPTYYRSFPDMLVLIDDRWLALEVKRDSKASRRPNQEHYVKMLNDMSFSRFIFPENIDMVLYEIEKFIGY